MSRRSKAARPRPAAVKASAAPPIGSAVEAHADPPIRRALGPLDIAAWVVAVMLGVGLLIMIAGPHRVGDVFTETDFYGGYAEGARAILHGRLDPSRYGVVGPGYELVLALAGLIVRNLFVAAELVSVVATVAGVLFWFALLRRRSQHALALLAVLFLATNATLFRYGYSATTDALAFALQALALLLLLARDRPRDALLAGAAAAFAFLTRYSAIYLLPAGLLALALGGTLQPRRRRAFLLFAAGFAALVGPWVLYSLAHGGTFASQLHHNIAYDVFARSKGIVWDDYQKLMQPQFHSLGDVIARDPGAVARRELFNVYDHLRLDASDLLGWPVAIAAGVGLILGVLDGTLWRLWPLMRAGILAFLVLVPVFYSQRYSLPLLPFYAVIAAAAFVSPRLARLAGRSGVALVPWLAVVPLAFAVQGSVREQQRVIGQLPIEVLETAQVLRGEARPDDGIIARKAHIAFHAGLRAVAFPFTSTLPELADYARAHHARWLYFSWPEAEMRPDYWYLLDTTGVVPGLTVRHATRHHPAVLYEIGPTFGAVPDWVRNDTLRALHIARARLTVDARDFRGIYTLGFIARTEGRLDEASAWLAQAERLKPGDLATALLQGEVFLVGGQPDRARAAFQRALTIDPTNVAGQVGLGWIADMQHQPEEAGRLWRPVIGRTRDGATLRRMLQVYEGLGDAASVAETRAALARLAGRS